MRGPATPGRETASTVRIEGGTTMALSIRRLSPLVILVLLLLALCASAAPAAAAPDLAGHGVVADAWTPTYPAFTPYDQLKTALDELVATSDRVRYDVIGQSAGGRDLYLVTVARPDVLAHLDDQLAFRQLMLSDPAKAQQQLQDGADIRVPVFVNCSIHGNEPNGTDAGLRMLRRLAVADDAETQAVLDHCIVLVNICQNPDGRVADTRANDNGFDLNRDFLLLTQPETRATAQQIARWLPTMFFDLHGYYTPMRIDPCTPPHNPNYEYDLFIKWALPTALGMRDAVKAATSHGVNIPYLDMQQGYEDYSPFYTPQFAMYYGAIGLTLETFAENDLGTTGDYSAIWSGARFAAANATAMQVDQAEQFRRGATGYQRSEIRFPYAYVIPADALLQRSPLQAARVVDFMCAAGVRVDTATAPFSAAGVQYPAGTYVVPMRQPLRDLANTWLWNGQDVSYLTNAMYSTCATSLPQLLGFDRTIVAAPFAAALTPADGATWPDGGVAPGPGARYLFANDGNGAVRAANELMADGASVSIVTGATAAVPTGTFVVGDASPAELDGIADREHIVFEPTVAVTTATKPLHPVALGVYGTSDVRWSLKKLGFSVTALGATSSLSAYDCVLGNRTALSASNLKTFVRGGGGYVGVGYDGTSGPLGNMLPVTINVTNAYDNNAIVHARYRSDRLVGAYFKADDFAFVERPIWFTSVKPGATIDAWYGDGADWYVCGYWRDRAGAKGKPAIVSGTYGTGNVAYIGFEPAFRGYPEGQYRLMANAIWFAMK
jgi:hypothetical protein